MLAGAMIGATQRALLLVLAAFAVVARLAVALAIKTLAMARAIGAAHAVCLMAAVDAKVARGAETFAVGALAMPTAVHRARLGVLASLAGKARVAIAVARRVITATTTIAALLAWLGREAWHGGVAASATETAVAVAHALTALPVTVAIVRALCF